MPISIEWIILKNDLCVDDEIGGKGCHDQQIEGEVEEPEVHQPVDADQYVVDADQKLVDADQ